jgi:predicted nucleic acid-binding protein
MKTSGRDLRVGSQDLRIAAITPVNRGVIITRNQADFSAISGLLIEELDK